MQSRRTALITLATATASAAMAPGPRQHSQHEHAEDDKPVAPPKEPSYFSKPDYETVSRLIDLIIPRTDTPGALDAGVPFRVDRQVGLTPKLQAEFRRGLTDLSAESRKQFNAEFSALTEPQQIAMMTVLCEAPANSEQNQFFAALKNLTIEWYYRSEEGLVTELGFHGNTFRASFPGCTHPAHWPHQEKV